MRKHFDIAVFADQADDAPVETFDLEIPENLSDLSAADDNHARKDGEGDAHCQSRYVKGDGNGGGDGVCLRGVTDKTQCDNQGDGEEAR